MKHILDFCAGCGSLLPSGLGSQPEPTCPNCGESVKDRTNRIQGEFEKEEADKLLITYSY